MGYAKWFLYIWEWFYVGYAKWFLYIWEGFCVRVRKMVPIYMGVAVGVGLHYIIMRFPIYIGVKLCRGTQNHSYIYGNDFFKV